MGNRLGILSLHVKAPSAVEVSSGIIFDTAEYRIDGRDKVTGRAVYAADIAASDALWAGFVESPYAHAKIRSIDARAAFEVPGVRAVLTAEDIGRVCFGRNLCDWPVLAFDTVRFVGDRVAMVAAETRTAAAAAAAAIAVDYEPLDAVFDITSAIDPSAPVLHPQWEAYTRFERSRDDVVRSHPNIFGSQCMQNGAADLESIFATAHRVYEHRFETPRTYPGFVEPRATLVWIRNGVLHVQTPNKTPFLLRRQLAHVTGLSEPQIIIEPAAIGGDFGGKGFTPDEFACYFLAKATGRPVRHIATYDEELRRGPTRHHAVMTLRTAVAQDGALLAHQSTVYFDGGAYAATKQMRSLLPGAGYASIAYRIPHFRVDLFNVYTNTLPAAHVRAPGKVQTFTAWEQHIDLIARDMGFDPIDFRRKNVIRAGQIVLSGETVDEPMAVEVLDRLQQELDALPRRGNSGHGVSLVGMFMGGGSTAVKMRLFPDGRLRITGGFVDQGTGIATVVQRVVATELQIDPARISVVRDNTNAALPDPGSGAVRVTHIVGRAALEAAYRLQERIAIERKDAPSAGFDELAERICGDGVFDVVGTFSSGLERIANEMPFAACGIDVDVDTETGAIAVREAILVLDVGRIINPVAHRGQIDGGFIFGLGAALTEGTTFDENGRLAALSLADYKLPTIRDIPPLKVVLLPGPAGNGPFGARMIGEMTNMGVLAAIANAINDAVGVRIHHFPIRAEDIYAGLQA